MSKKNMVILSLLLVLSKMFYNVYTYIYDTQNAAWEKFFNIGILFFIFYYGITDTDKVKKKS